MNDEILAIDPGREKTGIAILKNSDVLEHKIINSDELVQIIKSLLEKYIIKTIVMGNGTSSKKKYDLLKQTLNILFFIYKFHIPHLLL